jgi:hypothetical protein
MPLRLLNIKPGFNKQFTASGAEGQWIDGDFVRFRYGLPEKIGGWETLTSDKLIGAVRAQHIWADLNNRRYAALGSNAALFIYHEGVRCMTLLPLIQIYLKQDVILPLPLVLM